jgi:hypothetical protein
MNDLEMLMLAAKAAGLKVIIPAAPPRGLWIEGLEDEWNPLEDDGDALRLAVKLNISVFFRPNFVHAEIATSAHEGLVLQEPPTPDKNAATRRAIVRAAAQIGEHMEKNNGN